VDRPFLCFLFGHSSLFIFAETVHSWDVRFSGCTACIYIRRYSLVGGCSYIFLLRYESKFQTLKDVRFSAVSVSYR
jgi:hypothetical protein